MTFPKRQFVMAIPSGNDETILGKFKLAKHTELTKIGLRVYLHGLSSFTGNEEIRLYVFMEGNLKNSIGLSDYVPISKIKDLGTTNWLGWVNIPFSTSVPLSKDITYHVGIKVSGTYTPNLSSYISGVFDWPLSIYPTLFDPASTKIDKHPISMIIYGLPYELFKHK